MSGVGLDIVMADVFVTSVNFSEGSIEIAFLEHREQTDKAAILRSMMISLEDDERLQDAFRDLQALLCEIVDTGYEMIRNPREKMSIRDQMIARRTAAEPEDV